VRGLKAITPSSAVLTGSWKGLSSGRLHESRWSQPLELRRICQRQQSRYASLKTVPPRDGSSAWSNATTTTTAPSGPAIPPTISAWRESPQTPRNRSARREWKSAWPNTQPVRTARGRCGACV